MKDIQQQALTKLGNPDWTPNWTIGRPGPYMEITELANRTVWLCQEPIRVCFFRTGSGFHGPVNL